jgi:FKBP-type peptidyl-prolyl cis-trans isomerase
VYADIDVQTENYLEELTDAVRTDVANTQTDAFLDRPPTPLFVPQKIGVDVETQIQDGDLFDFDLEVDPIIEVIAGKTLEQALMEVLEEEELANLRHHQDEFDRIRNAELAETQRMEAAEKRRFEEKQRRLQQEVERMNAEQEVASKVAARTFAKTYVGDLVGEVFSGLADSGYFFDPLEKEVETEFMPWLIEQATANLGQMRTERSLVDQLIASAIELRNSRRKAKVEERAAAVAAAEAAAAAAAAAEAAAAAAAAAAAEAEAEAEPEGEPAPE